MSLSKETLPYEVLLRENAGSQELIFAMDTLDYFANTLSKNCLTGPILNVEGERVFYFRTTH